MKQPTGQTNKKTNQNTQKVNKEHFFLYGLDKTMRTHVQQLILPSTKRRTDKTDIKHEMW